MMSAWRDLVWSGARHRPAAVQPMTVSAARGRRDRGVPHRCAKAASPRSRWGLSPSCCRLVCVRLSGRVSGLGRDPEIQELKLALAEATVQLRIWPKGDLPDRIRWRRPTAAPRPRPRPEPADQRRHRTLLRHLNYEHLYRAPIDDGGAPAMETAAYATSTTASGHISSRRSNTAPGLPRGVTQRRAEGPIAATRHRAGLTRHPVIELARRRLSAPLLCRWRFTCETARAASVGALGHGRRLGRYEELSGSEVGRVQAFANAR